MQKEKVFFFCFNYADALVNEFIADVATNQLPEEKLLMVEFAPCKEGIEFCFLMIKFDAADGDAMAKATALYHKFSENYKHIK